MQTKNTAVKRSGGGWCAKKKISRTTYEGRTKIHEKHPYVPPLST